nr:calphotin isoform X2 [Salvelinus alpinus]XP_023842606.1 calphotin isoform X2 [Salvelinus alpinus]
MINDIRKDESDFSPRPEDSVIGVPEQPPAEQDVTWLKPWRSHRQAPDQGDSPSALQIANRTHMAMTIISPSPPTTVDIGDLSDVLNFTPELHFIPAPIAMVEVDTPLESLSPPVYSEDTLDATIVSSFEPVAVPILEPLVVPIVSILEPVEVPNVNVHIVSSFEPVEVPNVDLPIMDVTIVNSLEPLQAPIVDAPIVSSLEPVEHADATVINDLDIPNAPVGLENLDAPVINSLDTLVLDALIVNSLEPVDIPVINDLDTPDTPIVNVLDTLELDAPIIDVPIVDSLAPVEFPIMNDIDLLEAPAEFSSSFNPQLEVEVHVDGEDQNQGLSLCV